MSIREGTSAWWIYVRLQAQMSRVGLRVDFTACEHLAVTIQRHGHASVEARALAEKIGLDPTYLPRRYRG